MAGARRSLPPPPCPIRTRRSLGEGAPCIYHTILGKHLAIRVRHLFGKGRHELGVGGRDLGLDGLRRKVCGGGTDGCSNALGDCQLFGRGLPTVVGEASFDLCDNHHELGVDGLDMVVGGLHQG